MPPTNAIVRAPSLSFVDALGQDAGVSIDLVKARRQHAAYVAALREMGLKVKALPELESHPDACFVEDTAVVFGDAALVTRPGAPSRQGEEAAIAWALANVGLDLMTMQPPATLDGGDVLRVGDVFFVGRSARSNAEGIATLTEFAEACDATVVAVDLPAGLLHLKCHVSALSDDTVLAVEGLALPLPAGVRRLDLPRAEAFAANAVAVGANVLVAAGFPRTLEILTAAGFTPRAIDTSELAKAAGSLTCLSILS